jgi:dolichol kinase
MIGFLLAAIGTAAILLIGQLLWQDKLLKGESARKFIHITVASYAAFWPYFVDRWWIVILSGLLVLALLTIKKLKIFKSMTEVKRATYGEICFALGIGVLALVFKNNYIFTIALLHMALADGFAAIIGVHLADNAKNFYYKGSRKSWAGTATFILVSFILNLAYWMVVSRISLHGNLIGLSPIFYSLLSAVALAGVEIVAPKGTDNVAVPFVAGLLLWLPVVIFI